MPERLKKLRERVRNQVVVLKAFSGACVDVISFNDGIHVLLRYPEERQDAIFVIFIFRREHQYKCRDIRGGGEVEPAVTDAAL